MLANSDSGSDSDSDCHLVVIWRSDYGGTLIEIPFDIVPIFFLETNEFTDSPSYFVLSQVLSLLVGLPYYTFKRLDFCL